MLPPLRQDLKLITECLGPSGSPAWLLHDRPRNRFFRLGWLESEMLRRWSTVETKELLCNHIHQETTLTVSTAQVDQFIAFLTTNQLSQPPLGQEYARIMASREKSSRWFDWLLHHYLFFSVPLLRPDRLLKNLLKRLPWVIHPGFLTLAILSGILGIYLVSRRWDVFLTTLPQMFSWQGILIVALAIFLSKVVHELGHALLATHYGCRIPTVGVAFLVMWPVLYADTSDLWRLPSRTKRLKVVAAGMAAEFILAGLATLLWNFTQDGLLKSALLALATVTWITTLIINGNPFMRFDGYFFLSDWLDMANLQERSFAMGRWQLRRSLLGLRVGPPERFSPSRQRFLIFFAWGTWVYRFFLFLGIALLVYHFFFKVLGLFLMLVEIYWFILGPIRRELGFWVKQRSHLHRGAVSTLAVLFLIFLGFFGVPWQGRVILPAILRSQTFTTLYPPTEVYVAQIHVPVGQWVSEGDRLFTLASPKLDQQLALNRLDRARFLHESQRPGVHPSDREQRLVAVRLLAAARAEHKGLQALQKQQQILAPFSGILTQLAEHLTPGRWLRREQPLAHLHQPGEEQIRAYVDEDRLQHIEVGQKGLFFPKDPTLPTFPVRVVNIELSALARLEWPHLASVYDGPLAVRQDDTERLIPENALYRIHLNLEDSSPTVPKAILLGEVSLLGKKTRLGTRVWHAVMAVLVRESGF